MYMYTYVPVHVNIDPGLLYNYSEHNRGIHELPLEVYLHCFPVIRYHLDLINCVNY